MCILQDKRFDTKDFILHQLISEASIHKSPIAYGGLITAIAHAWGLKPQIRQMNSLLTGEEEAT